MFSGLICLMRVGGQNQSDSVWLDERAGDVDERHEAGAPRLLAALAASEALPPWLSARDRLVRWQWEATGLLIVLLVIALVFYRPRLEAWAQVIFWLLFALTVMWRLALTIIGTLRRLGRAAAGRKRPIPGGDLPVYSILIALRHEALMMDQLAATLSAIDWPKTRLDILLLIEVDDVETRAAAQRACFPAGTRILTVPEGAPLTKPRALNYGLAAARGEMVTVYDAEDRPDPRQLREAFDCFARGPGSLVCVQAPLIASNEEAAWVAAQWTLEYDVQFGLHVPALAELGYPVMLGGTSNHFRRADLLAFGGWDAWNVTEDADLGLRAARLGGRTGVIAAPTYESAPDRFAVWSRQRSRWIKGYIQTWLVCMRTPVKLVRELGVMRYISLQLTLGGAILSAFFYGPMALMILLGTVLPWFSYTPVDLTLFVCGWVGCVAADLLAPGKWTAMRLLAVVTRPLYWPLQTLAAINAIYGLAVRPSFWAKTPHHPEEKPSEAACQTGLSPSDSSPSS